MTLIGMRMTMVAAIFFGCMPSFVSAATGSVSGYAWGENLGWVNFGCTECSASVSDTAMTGYAWSDVAGWINLAPTNGGVTHDGNGVLGGHAWSERLGWIPFTGANINTTTGIITGTCGEASSTAGRLNFGCTYCSAVTAWRPTVVSTPAPSSGGGGGGSPALFGVVNQPAATTSATNDQPVVTRDVLETLVERIAQLRERITALVSSAESDAIPEDISTPTEAIFDETQCPYFSTPLQFGDSGKEVVRLQRFLKDRGFLVHSTDEGNFGTLTLRAVLAFQRAYARDILESQGVSRPTGQWFALSRWKANQLLGCTTSIPGFLSTSATRALSQVQTPPPPARDRTQRTQVATTPNVQTPSVPSVRESVRATTSPSREKVPAYATTSRASNARPGQFTIVGSSQSRSVPVATTTTVKVPEIPQKTRTENWLGGISRFIKQFNPFGSRE